MIRYSLSTLLVGAPALLPLQLLVVLGWSLGPPGPAVPRVRLSGATAQSHVRAQTAAPTCLSVYKQPLCSLAVCEVPLLWHTPLQKGLEGSFDFKIVTSRSSALKGDCQETQSMLPESRPFPCLAALYELRFSFIHLASFTEAPQGRGLIRC